MLTFFTNFAAMIDVSQHVVYLLLGNDCVILPGLGAFVAEIKPAHYDSKSHLYMAPHHIFHFNPALTHDDGLLYGSIMERHKITRDAAAREVKKFISGDEIKLKGLGTLRQQEGTASPIFTPHLQGVLKTCQDAWQPVAVKENEEALPAGEESRYKDEKHFVMPQWSKYAAVAVLAIALFASGYYAPNIDLNKVSTACLSLFSPVNEPKETTLPELDSKAIDLIISTPPVVEELTSTTPTVPVEKIPVVQQSKPFAVVIAAFKTQKEALKKLVNEADPSLQYLKNGKFHFIIAGETDTYQQAFDMALQVSKKYPNAWAFKKYKA